MRDSFRRLALISEKVAVSDCLEIRHDRSPAARALKAIADLIERTMARHFQTIEVQ